MSDQQFCMTCGTRNGIDSTFCMKCGTKLHGVSSQAASRVDKQWICPNCGRHNQADSVFCMECGTHLTKAAPDVEDTSTPEKSSDITPYSDLNESFDKAIMNDESTESFYNQSDASADYESNEGQASVNFESSDYMLTHFEREDIQLVYATLAGVGCMAEKLNHQLDSLRNQVERLRWFKMIMVACLILSIASACIVLVVTRLVPIKFAIPVIVTCGIVFIIALIVGVVLFINVLSGMKASNPQDVYAVADLEETVRKLRDIALTLLPLIPEDTRSLSTMENIADTLSTTDEDPSFVIAAQHSLDRNYPFICEESQLRSNSTLIEPWKQTVTQMSKSFEAFRTHSQLKTSDDPQRIQAKRRLCAFAGVSFVLDFVLIGAFVITAVAFPIDHPVFTEPNDASVQKGQNEANNSGQEQITYPPYPGGISKAEYDSYVADMTTETEIQSMHTGMWQIADCVTMGISTTGNAALPNQPAGIRADQSDDFSHWIPNPSDGRYCVTRGYLSDSGSVSVQAFDTFIPLSRDEIDLEAALKPNMIIEKYQKAIGEDLQGAGVGAESESTATSVSVSDIVAHVNQDDYSDIAGMYCRHNGACLDISQDGLMELVDESGIGITPADYDSMYPFSPYLRHLSIGESETEDGLLVRIPMKADPEWSCAPGTVTSMSSCSAPDGSYVFLNVVMYYAPPNTDLNQCSGISLDGVMPDTSRAFLIFQLESGTNAPFSATNDEVFYRV